MGLGTEHQPGALARGLALGALLALAAIVAVSTASMFMSHIRDLYANGSGRPGPPAAAVYEPR